VQLETDGLELALQQLAAGVESRLKTRCRFDCPQPVFVSDNAVATHIYRIAQEAVNNAVKHGKASLITIGLSATEERIELKVSDNGGGISVPAGSAGGMGLHIMNYRARTIGGTLQIGRATGGGTVVLCSAPQDAV
jgi:signal transduction histidine kinase